MITASATPARASVIATVGNQAEPCVQREARPLRHTFPWLLRAHRPRQKDLNTTPPSPPNPSPRHRRDLSGDDAGWTEAYPR